MNRTFVLICMAKALRTFAFGAIAVVLALYLGHHGFNVAETGAVFSGTLIEDAIVTLLIASFANVLGLKRILVFSALAIVLSGLLLGLGPAKWIIVASIIFGIISPAGYEGGAFTACEQTIVSEGAPPEKLTRAFSIYNLSGFAGAALGSLVAGLIAAKEQYNLVFYMYALVGVGLLVVYGFLNVPQTQASKEVSSRPDKLSPTQRVSRNPWIALLAGLQSIDALGGGFLVQSLLTYWFVTKFGCSAAFVGGVYFVTNIIAAASFLAAPVIARRFGLLNTMVFTHLPCSLALCALPFMPDAIWAAGLLVARSLFSSMDIPARQSFAVLLVEPQDRPFAVAVTNGSRAIAQGLSPSIAGWVLSLSGSMLGVPIIMGGVLKTVYDLTVFACFSRFSELGTVSSSDKPAPSPVLNK